VKTFAADLHIHTTLSPCAADEMTSQAIIESAIGAGLDIIAICDHNSAENVRTVQEAAQGRLCVLAGMELTTSEDVHVLGIFPDVEAAKKVGHRVSLIEAIRLIRECGGLAIAAHINRPSFSIFSQLGIFPDESGFNAIEIFISPLSKIDWDVFKSLGLPMIVSSDSHYPADIGRNRTIFKMQSACFDELAMAINGVGGRGVKDLRFQI
jgi:3',5'-nucleoside bisphosphate phosphatase